MWHPLMLQCVATQSTLSSIGLLLQYKTPMCEIDGNTWQMALIWKFAGEFCMKSGVKILKVCNLVRMLLIYPVELINQQVILEYIIELIHLSSMISVVFISIDAISPSKS